VSQSDCETAKQSVACIAQQPLLMSLMMFLHACKQASNKVTN